jgi:peptidoglycan/xylan/chitin deacetylase (PgdA/CDA1 family)
MRGHLYCSTRCARDAGRVVWRNRMRDRLKRPISSRVAVLLVLLALGAPTLLALRAVAELDRLNSASPFLTPRRPAPSARIESVTESLSGARIEGSAPAGSAVFLFAGARFIGAAFSAEGRFRFEDVRTAGPYRVGAMFLSPEPASPAVPPPSDTVPAAPSPEPSTLNPQPSGPSDSRLSTLDSRLPAIPDITRGPADRREILVSFDAGSSSRGAREILDALRGRGIRTTMFLTGDFIRRYPDLTRQIAADGHEVGNHTDTHSHLTTYARDGRQATRSGIDRAFLLAELTRTARLYGETTGRSLAPLWRAPYGEQNGEIRRWAAEAGYWHVGWTGGRAGLDGLDWVSDPASPSYRSSQRVISRLIANAENGGIVLLHLGSDRDDPVAPRVAELLDGLSRNGFHLVRASEFLDREGFTPGRLVQLTSRESRVPSQESKP